MAIGATKLNFNDGQGARNITPLSTAPVFSSSASYAVGDLVYHEDVLYKCTTAHSGVWSASHFTAVTIGSELQAKAGEIDDLKTDLSNTTDGIVRAYKDAKPITYTINQNRVKILNAFYTVENGYMHKVILLQITTSAITSANTWTLGTLTPYANLKTGQSYVDYTAVSLTGEDISNMTFRQNSNSQQNFMVVTTGAVTEGQGGIILLTSKQVINAVSLIYPDTSYPQKLVDDTTLSVDLFNSDFASANYAWHASNKSLQTLNGYSYIKVRVFGGSSIVVRGLSESLSAYGYGIQDETGAVLASAGEAPGMIIDVPENGYWLIFTFPSSDSIEFIPYFKKKIVVLGDSWSDNDPTHTTYTKWTTLLQNDGRYEVKVYAQNGSSISGDTPNYAQNGNVLGQFEQLKTDNLQGIDTIIIMGGINDFRNGVLNNSVYQKLQYFYTELNKLYPNARIIYISNNQIYITQQQLDYFNGIIGYLRAYVGMEAYTSFGWVKANHYISDHVHVDNNGYQDLYANILAILTGGQLQSVETSYQHVVAENDTTLCTMALRETWNDGHVSYAVKLVVTNYGLDKSFDVDLNASDGNIVASVPFTKVVNKAFTDTLGVTGAVIYSDVAETFATTNKLNLSNHIKIVTPSANSGTYLTDNYN